VYLLDEQVRRGVRPTPVPTARVAWSLENDDAGPSLLTAAGGSAREFAQPFGETEELAIEDESVYAGTTPYPERIAWLGDIGVFRLQRYVEVHLAPIRWDPHLGGIRIARSYEVTVHFNGDDLVRSRPTEDPPFELVYRNAFVNYAQGKTFRLGAEQESSGFDPSRWLDRAAGVTTSPPPPRVPRSLGAASRGGGDRTLGPTADPRRKIKVRQNGIVRLDYNRMGTTGFPSYPLAQWKLTSNGVEVPLDLHDVNANGLLDPGDWVQFFGQALDFDPKTVLNTDFPNTNEDLYEARDFTDENVYFLAIESGARARMPARASDPTFTRTPAADFESTAHREVNDAWRPLGAADPWYWAPTQSNPPSGSSVASRTESVDLPGLVSAQPARVLVNLRGASEDSATYPDHKTRVTLKNSAGTSLTSQDDNGTFDGRTLYTHDFVWTYPGSGPLLTSPAQVTIDALSVAGSAGYFNQLILDWIEIRYRRTFTASADQLTFDFPDGDAEFVVSGLQSSDIAIYETTSTLAGGGLRNPTRLTGFAVTGAGTYSVRFRMDNDPALADGTLRRFVVAGAGGVSSPPDADFPVDVVSDLRNNLTRADLIVIAHPTVLDQTSGGPLDRLLSLRATQGIASKVVLIEDIQDEFNDGLPGPVAIRNFLRWVMSASPGEGWASPKPSYVLLLGDASYDYKAGTVNGNYVPTQIMFKDVLQLGYYASDSLMAAVVGNDQLADLAVGRISARSSQAANVVLDKIERYESATPGGNWARHALFVSDRGKNCSEAESLDFEATNDAAAAFMKAPPHTLRKLRYWSDYCTYDPNQGVCVCDPARMNGDIKRAVNGTDGVADGAAMVQFVGHSNFNVWSDDAFFAEGFNGRYDVNDLVNGERLPWMLAHNCLTGGFHTTQANTMGEDWVLRSGGGAVAVMSPSGLTFNFIGRAVSDKIWEDLFGRTKERTVEVVVMDVLSALCGQGSIEACQNHVFLGDPATRLVIPSVGPARSLAATPGNASVTLNWTASVTSGAVYDVYRTYDLAGSYTKANTAPLTIPSFTDTGLRNTTTYYYYVVALDAEGFESRWSNFNSDCAVNGPDCVKATPVNPSPPAPPSGVVVTDPATGNKLNVSWAANPESDLAYYEVHWGTSSGSYASVRNVGRSTSTVLTDLANGITYYVAVTATNTSGHSSGYSQEKTGVPTAPPKGLTSPQVIVDLRVSKSGNDVRLSWSAVTKDIYGGSETVARYEVFRGTAPNFVPSDTNRIGSPTTASFTDVGALGAGLPNYYYLVRAVDNEGNVGGLGGQLPNGIDALRVTKSTTTLGNVVLSWPAISTDYDGKPARIDHYEVYASDKPFKRVDIRDGRVPRISTVTSTSLELTPPAASQYYSVLAVDARGNVSPF
jgi:hypothetical protein